jgi:hypothetical protein
MGNSIKIRYFKRDHQKHDKILISKKANKGVRKSNSDIEQPNKLFKGKTLAISKIK